MFSDMFSFKKRKKLQVVQGMIRRIVDLSTPDFRHQLKELRKEKRAARSLPVLIVPFVDDQPMMNHTSFGVTRDLSSTGVSVLAQNLIESAEIGIGFWLDGACEFFRGTVRHRRPSDGGYWQIGVELDEVLDHSRWPQIRQLSLMASRLAATSSDISTVNLAGVE